MHYNGKAIFLFKFITNKKRKWFHCINIHTLIWNSLNLALEHSYSLNYTSSGVNLWQIQLIWKGTHVLIKGLPANNAYNAGGSWGETPHMIVKRFGCTTIHNKVLYKCIIHSFIHLFVRSFVRSFIHSFIHIRAKTKSWVQKNCRAQKEVCIKPHIWGRAQKENLLHWRVTEACSLCYL